MKNPRISRAHLRVGPGPWPIRAHFIRITLLCGVGKNGQKNFGASHNQIMDPPLPSNLNFVIHGRILYKRTQAPQSSGSCLCRVMVVVRRKQYGSLCLWYRTSTLPNLYTQISKKPNVGVYKFIIFSNIQTLVLPNFVMTQITNLRELFSGSFGPTGPTVWSARPRKQSWPWLKMIYYPWFAYKGSSKCNRISLVCGDDIRVFFFFLSFFGNSQTNLCASKCIFVYFTSRYYLRSTAKCTFLLSQKTTIGWALFI